MENKKSVENFEVTPQLRWVEKWRPIDEKESNIYMQEYKVLQQLHRGNRGTEKWEDVPSIKFLDKPKKMINLANKGTECKPPDWGNPKNLEAYSWCINHGVTISALATVAGFSCKTWVIEVTANGKKITSPKEYGPNDLYEKIFELYRFYYDKYN